MPEKAAPSLPMSAARGFLNESSALKTALRCVRSTSPFGPSSCADLCGNRSGKGLRARDRTVARDYLLQLPDISVWSGRAGRHPADSAVPEMETAKYQCACGAERPGCAGRGKVRECRVLGAATCRSSADITKQENRSCVSGPPALGRRPDGETVIPKTQMSQDATVCHAEGGGLCNHGRDQMVLRDHAARSALCGD